MFCNFYCFFFCCFLLLAVVVLLLDSALDCDRSASVMLEDSLFVLLFILFVQL
jgi:hypothetical protein